jgi:hypothetical protein
MTSIWVDYLTNEECSEIENVIRYLDQKDWVVTLNFYYSINFRFKISTLLF